MSNLSPEIKKRIDALTYEDLLAQWRFARVGDPMFQGECGEYFSRVMFAKRDALSNQERVTVSKRVGWG